MRLVQGVLAAVVVSSGSGAAQTLPSPAAQLLGKHCMQCHGKAASGGVNLELMTADRSPANHFQQWRKVAAVLEEKRMPPPAAPQPTEASRQLAVRGIQRYMGEIAARNAGDPGKVTMRRLTGGEYNYSIQDLTGLDLKLDRDFEGDSAGGEGFTNFGDVQFVGDASLERYLRAAKTVASHAVIGAGPLQFYSDPGKSGMELSAIHRIQGIYTRYGFRAASAEGGKPYGLDRYSKALYAAWRYKHRGALGESNLPLEKIGEREGLTPRFTQHIWKVVNQSSPGYPSSEVVSRWKALPAPSAATREQTAKTARAQCQEIQHYLVEWPRWLFGAGGAAEGGQGDERALVLTDESVQAKGSERLRFGLRVRGQKTAVAYLSTASLNPNSKDAAYAVWKNASIRFRSMNRAAGQSVPLDTVVSQSAKDKLKFGKSPGGEIGAHDFALAGGESAAVEITVPEGTGFVEFQVEATIVPGPAGDAVLRCTLNDRAEIAQGRPVSVILGSADAAGYKTWKTAVLEFARDMPQTSHGEPTPADRDPIPLPQSSTTARTSF